MCTDPIQNVPNSRHSLEEQPVHLATCTITLLIVAPVQLARLLRWRPRQAKPPLHGGCRRT